MGPEQRNDTNSERKEAESPEELFRKTIELIENTGLDTMSVSTNSGDEYTCVVNQEEQFKLATLTKLIKAKSGEKAGEVDVKASKAHIVTATDFHGEFSVLGLSDPKLAGMIEEFADLVHELAEQTEEDR